MGNPNVINQSTSFTGTSSTFTNGFPLRTIDEKERQAFEAIMDEFEDDFLKQEKDENEYNNSLMNKNNKKMEVVQNEERANPSQKSERAHLNSRADSWTTLSSKANSSTSESSTRPNTALDVNEEEGHQKVKYNKHHTCKAWRKIPNSCIRINEDIYSTPE